MVSLRPLSCSPFASDDASIFIEFLQGEYLTFDESGGVLQNLTPLRAFAFVF